MIRNSQGKRPEFYDTPGMDQVMSMVMVLAEEVSVLTDHVDSLERAAAAQGMDLKKGIETLELDEAALKQRESRRQQFFDRLFYLLRKEAEEAAGKQTRESFDNVIAEIAKN